jgi:hypothetical protein
MLCSSWLAAAFLDTTDKDHVQKVLLEDCTVLEDGVSRWIEASRGAGVSRRFYDLEPMLYETLDLEVVDINVLQ